MGAQTTSAPALPPRRRAARGPGPSPLPADDRRHDHHPSPRAERGGEVRSLARDEDVDLPAQARTGLAQAVAHPGPAGVQRVDRLADRAGLELELAHCTGKEPHQGTGQADPDQAHPATTRVSTDSIVGRWRATSRQLAPSSLLANRLPPLVPK